MLTPNVIPIVLEKKSELYGIDAQITKCHVIIKFTVAVIIFIIFPKFSSPEERVLFSIHFSCL